MSKQELELPNGWVNCHLEDLTTAINSGFPSGKHNKSEKGIPHIRPMNIDYNGKIDLSVLKYVEVNSKDLLQKNDVLFNNTNSPKLLGKTTLIQSDTNWAYSNHMTRIKLNQSLVLPTWISIYLHKLFWQGYYTQIAKNHVNQSSVNSTDLSKKVTIILAPLNEQKRIVSKIEELFSKIDSTKQSLEQTKLQLELYRQSLLKSVFSEFGKDSLSNISIINPAKPGKGEIDDNLDVSFIPMKCVEEESGKIDLSNIRKFGDVKKGFTYFQNKDLIFAKITPCMENGKIAIVDNLKNGMGFGSTEFHVIRFEDEYSPKFYFWYLIQDIFRDTAEQNMKGTAGQKRVQTNYLKEVQVPISTIEEKKQTIQIIEEKMPLIQNTTQIVNSTLQTLQTMKMSVLKQAFEGKLVPQDPNDEPAEKLLERIKKEKS